MTLTLELSAELESRLKAEAVRHGMPLAEYALRLLEGRLKAVDGQLRSRIEKRRKASRGTASREPPTARELLAMSPEERDRLLETQAADAEPLYAADLARPVSERELTALTALDGEPLHETD